MTSRLNVSNIADGISVIDSGYFSKDFAAIYLLRQGNEVAIIETGNMPYRLYFIHFVIPFWYKNFLIHLS